MESVPKPAAAGRPRGSTIADVAKRAGVGVGTVSRVLNRSARVSDATRERVLAVIAELDYRPSQTARNLKLGVTHRVAVVVPFVTHASAVERLAGFIQVMTRSTYSVMLLDIEQPEQRDEQLRNLARGGQADGVLVVSLSPTDADVARFRASRTPLVLLDASHPAVPHIVIDNVRGGALAAEHLLRLGHRRIAFVGDATTHFGWVSDRRRGFQGALRAAGIEPARELMQSGEHGRAPARELAARLLALSDPPTAVFAESDTQALGVLDAAREAGVAVPERLSVVGFDDLELADVVGLTTVRQPLRDGGARAGELLLALLRDGAGEPTREILPLELVERRTTAEPPAR